MLPKSHIGGIYTTKQTRHFYFYNDAEISQFKAKWAQRGCWAQEQVQGEIGR